MPNYMQTLVPGTSRRRAHLVVVNNPDDTSPAITYHEQDRITLADGTPAYLNLGALVVPVDAAAMAEVFPLVDVQTGAVLGTMTGAQLALGLQSHYVFKAQQRDAAQGA